MGTNCTFDIFRGKYQIDLRREKGRERERLNMFEKSINENNFLKISAYEIQINLKFIHSLHSTHFLLSFIFRSN